MARTSGSHADVTGPRVREAALKLFARHGYAAVSMRQIAREVGVQAGALYNYTPDKQSLLLTLLEEHMTALLAEKGAHGTGGSPTQRLEHFARFHIRYHHARPDAVFIAYMELRNLSPENFVRIERLRRAYEDELTAILQDGLKDGSFTLEEPRLSAFAIIAMLTGVNTWYRADGRLSLDDVETLYWHMVRRSVGAP